MDKCVKCDQDLREEWILCPLCGEPTPKEVVPIPSPIGFWRVTTQLPMPQELYKLNDEEEYEYNEAAMEKWRKAKPKDLGIHFGHLKDVIQRLSGEAEITLQIKAEPPPAAPKDRVVIQLECEAITNDNVSGVMLELLGEDVIITRTLHDRGVRVQFLGRDRGKDALSEERLAVAEVRRNWKRGTTPPSEARKLELQKRREEAAKKAKRRDAA